MVGYKIDGVKDDMTLRITKEVQLVKDTIQELTEKNLLVAGLVGTDDCRFTDLSGWVSWITSNTKYTFGELREEIGNNLKTTNEQAKKTRTEY